MKHNLQKAMQWLSGAGLSLAALGLKALGGWDAALGLLLGMMALDVATGLVLALMNRSDNTEGGGFLSRSLFYGLTRKLLMLLMVALGTALDGLLQSQVCRVTVIGFYAANEALSVVENAALAGVPFPKGLLMVLEKHREGRNEAGE